jgi:hypothetical protein
VMLADAVDIDADAIGQLDLFEEFANALRA